MHTIRVLILILLVPSLCFAYTPPKGIPNPSASFSTFGEIDQATPSSATKCPDWPASATAGCYYIDKTHGSATDTGNTYGYPNKPRATIPDLSLSAGNFVYIHAGTYTQNPSISGVGTANNPIWITGNPVTKPIISGYVNFGMNYGDTSYIVFENMQISLVGGGMDLRPNTTGITIDHILIRNNLFQGAQATGDDTAIKLGHSEALEDSSLSYVVIYDNIIRNIGPRTGEDDSGGINIQVLENVWVLNNTFSSLQEDAVGGCHQCGAEPRPSNVFVGGNTITDPGANCVDFKKVENVIISENTCSGTTFKGDGNNACFIIHYGGTPSDAGPRDSWIMYNTCIGMCGGVAVSYFENTLNVIGNLFYNIHWNVNTCPACTGSGAECGAGVASYGGSTAIATINIADNTFVDIDEPIWIDSDLGASATINITGNILSSRAQAGRYDINVDTHTTAASMDYNLFYYPSGNASIFYGGGAHTLTQLKDHTCTHCVEGDPSLSGSYKLQASSTLAIGANAESSAYDAFATYWAGKSFTLSAEYDRAGNARPLGGTWDIGAYEYDPGTVHPVMSISTGAGVSIGSGATMTLY